MEYNTNELLPIFGRLMHWLMLNMIFAISRQSTLRKLVDNIALCSGENKNYYKF